jgi:hypothetical protein
MPAISSEIRLIVWIITGISGALGTLITLYLQSNISYLFRYIFSSDHRGRIPTQKPLMAWILMGVFVLIFVIGTAFASSAPDISKKTNPTIIATQIPIIKQPIITTYTPNFTPTIAFTSTNTPTNIPTLIHTRYSIIDCINSNIWHFESNFDGSPKPSECLDLLHWSLSAQSNSIQETGLRINAEYSSFHYAGIYFFSERKETIRLKLDIEEIASLVTCTNICDVDLIIGLGDWRYNPGGWFIIYRSFNMGSELRVCLMKSSAQRCEREKGIELGSLDDPLLNYYPADGSIIPEQNITFDINNLDLGINVNDISRKGLRLSENYNSLWIAYRIIMHGRIKAFITFPNE